jgi:DNA-binding CsgD family transcriptional regulator
LTTAKQRHRIERCRVSSNLKWSGGVSPLPGWPELAIRRNHRHPPTPTELRVLLAVMQVGGASEVAEALGIAESTVRTHLLRLFAKTGTKGQADLIKLVTSYTNPLIS